MPSAQERTIRIITWVATGVELASLREDVLVGNSAKEALGDMVNEFFGSRRPWLCQFGGSRPVCQASWSKPWLWQFSDGISGPEPHTIHGIGPCDINSFDGTAGQLIAEWASGRSRPMPPLLDMVDLVVTAPAGVIVKVRYNLDRPARKAVLAQSEFLLKWKARA